MSTNTTTRSRNPITKDEIALAMEALKECSGDDGLTPIRGSEGMRMTPQGVLRATLGLSQKRSETVIHRLKTLGLVVPTEKSTKVIIAEMMPDIAEGETPQPTVTTVERIRIAVNKIRKENADLREENEKLKREVADLQRRVSSLEVNSGELEELETLLAEIEAA